MLQRDIFMHFDVKNCVLGIMVESRCVTVHLLRDGSDMLAQSLQMREANFA